MLPPKALVKMYDSYSNDEQPSYRKVSLAGVRPVTNLSQTKSLGRKWLGIGLLLGSALASAPTFAADGQTNFVSPAPETSVSAKQAANAARAYVDGRVLSVKQTPKGYRVRVLSEEGRVVTLLVDEAGRVKKNG